MGHKDIKKLLHELSKQGFDIQITKSSHYKIRKNGRFVATIPVSPSDWRSMNNAEKYLKKAGYHKETKG